MSRERNQNLTTENIVNLRLITYNSNDYANVLQIQKVEIYFLDPTNKTPENPDGRTLVQTVAGSAVTLDSTGNYSIAVTLSSPTYVIGKYLDIWSVVFKTNDPVSQHENHFEIFPDLWYTSTIPAVFGFDFHFQPNRIRQGSKKWLIIQIVPNVPRATDLQRYYTNLAISSNMKIWIEQNCGPCVPEEQDLRLIVDGDLVSIRDKVYGFYLVDTRDWDCGVYNIWFELDYAGNIEVSAKNQLQVF